jgi:putative DNA primase/helicase
MQPSDVEKYIGLGFSIHPLRSGTKVPILKNWVKMSSSDLSIVHNWINTIPDANFGVLAGPASGITVIDIDPRNGGQESWDLLVAKYGEVQAPMVRTPSGGFHIYFKYTAGEEKLGKGIDTLNNNNNVVLPGSKINGIEYSWLQGIPSKLPTMPSWMKNLIKAKQGNRNNDAYVVACNLFRNGKSFEEVLQFVLVKYGDESDPKHNEDLKNTVRSAEESADLMVKSYAELGGDIEIAGEFFANDYGNASIFIRNLGDYIKYVSDFGWVHYTNGAWRVDDAVAQYKYQQIIRQELERYNLIFALEPDADERRRIAERQKHFTQAMNTRAQIAALNSAAVQPNIQLDLKDLDSPRTAHLLNFSNGTVDLRTGALQPHNPSDFISKMIVTPYDPMATGSFWNSTLETLFVGDKELISYIQMMLGASLYGSQDTRMLFIAYGPTGKNGKSTFFEALVDVLGEYADSAELHMLASVDGGNLTELTTKMRIRGVRFVASSEISGKEVLSAATIKRLTGNDTISARNMFKPTTQFVPVCSIWLRANQLPTVYGADDAFYERICIIPFMHQFKETDMSASAAKQALIDEAPAILNWLVQGAVRWHNSGGTVVAPESSTKYRKQYIVDADPFAEFISEKLIEDANSEIKTSRLHAEYVRYSKLHRATQMSMLDFKQALRSRNLIFGDGAFISGYKMNEVFEI